MKIVFFSNKLKSAKKFPWVKKVILPILGIAFSVLLGVAIYFELPKNNFRLEPRLKPTDNLSITATDNDPVKLSNYSNIILPDKTDAKITIKIPILMYHYIEPQPLVATQVRRGLTITPKEFLAQMNWLKDNGYETMTLSELYKSFFEDLTLPKNPIILTFDDGYDDIFTYAAPIMQSLGQAADMFIITGSVGHYGYMDWAEIKKLSDLGFEIESHTVTHPSLKNLSGIKLDSELINSKKSLEDAIDKPVNFLCYPSGAYNQNVINKAEAAGYLAGITTLEGANISSTLLYEIPRIRIPGGISQNGFISLVHQASK